MRRDRTIDLFVKRPRHFRSFLLFILTSSTFLFSVSFRFFSFTNLDKARPHYGCQKKKKKKKRRTRNKKRKKREFILWVESRRRPESYVSRIWKAPGFLPGIIENRCRLSLYVDRRSLCTGWVKRRGGWEELSPRTTAFTTARIHPPLPFLLLLRHR